MQKGFFFPSTDGLKMAKPMKVKRGETPLTMSRGHKKSPSHQETVRPVFSQNNPFRSTLTENVKPETANKLLNFENNFDFNEFLQDSHQEPSPDILQRLLAENEQLKEKTRNNEEMVQKLLGLTYLNSEIIEDRYKGDSELKEKLAEVTKPSGPIHIKAAPKLQINVNALMAMKNKSETSILKKPRLFSNRGPRLVERDKQNGPRSAEGRMKEEGKSLGDCSSLRVLPNLGKKGLGLPRLPTSQSKSPYPKDIFSPGNKGSAFTRKNYKFQTLKPRVEEKGEEELRSTKGKFPKELFSMVSKKKFVI